MTPRQADVLTFLRDQLALSASPPSYRDIAAGVGLRSSSGVVRLIHGLAEQGLIRFTPGRRNSIEIVGGGLTAVELAWCERNAEWVRSEMDRKANAR